MATTVAEALATALGLGGGTLVVDLADVASEIFDLASSTVDRLTAQVARSRLVVAASPTYKASYTGLLKAFFDRYPNDGLSEVTAVPVMTGALALHALAPEVHLRPLLVELGASVPSRSLYVTEPELPELYRVVGAWAVAAVPRLAAALG